MKTYRKPDLTAPRFRPKRLNLLNSAWLKALRLKHPVLATYTDRQLKDILFTFHRLFREAALNNRDGVEFLSQLGNVFVGSCPEKVLANIDYKTSAELGVEVYHKNHTTDGRVAKIFYTNYADKYKFRFHELWMFDPGREFTRALPAAYREKWQFYRVINSKKKISYLFRKNLAERIEQERTAIGLQSYDEFDL